MSLVVVWLLAAAAATGAAGAQGILMPRPEIREAPFSVKRVRVSSSVTDAVAETTVEQTFVNDTAIEQEGTYLFPLPEGATVTSATLKAGDRVIEGRVMGKDEARGVYESIVRRRRDPALLEFMGRGLFRASIFPIPPHGERQLTLRYYELLRPEGMTRKFVYPLSTGRYSARPAEHMSVTIQVHTTAALKTVYSPTHDVSVRRQDDHSATASWEGGGEFPDRDFAVYYGTGADMLGLTALTYRTGDADGYFVLVASPGAAAAERPMPKQIVFVLDRTGSMQENGKLEQARNALSYCLDHLNATDRFDIVTFNESADLFASSLLSPTKDNIARAHRFVDKVDASGGTNIDEAIRAGLGLLPASAGNQRMLVLLTDGQPTVGELEPDKILAHAQEMNPDTRRMAGAKPTGAPAQTRIFCFGVGYDVDARLLDRLAEDAHGDADYVRPREDIESIVTAFYNKVASPILGDLHLSFGMSTGEEVRAVTGSGESAGRPLYSYDRSELTDVFPKVLPDVFAGGQLVIAGRFRGAPKGVLRVSGWRNGREVSFSLSDPFGEAGPRSALVPRIWATRKIGFLIDAARLHADHEVIDEIVRLSQEYGIITPYTSLLADDRDDLHAARPVPLRTGGVAWDRMPVISEQAFFGMRADKTGNSFNSNGTDFYGGGGYAAKDIAGSINARSYRDASRAPASTQAGAAGPAGEAGPAGAALAASIFAGPRSSLGLDYASAGQRSGSTQQAGYRQIQQNARSQVVAGHAFYRSGNVWFDNGYKSGTKVLQIKAASEAHFQALKARPEIARYAAVGEEVVISLGKVAIQIGATGKDRLTEAELKEIAAH